MDEKPDGLSTRSKERRKQPRYGVDDRATLLLLNHGLSVSGQIVDLSLSGCRLRVPRECRVSSPTRVEVTFKVNGMVFRLSGLAQWTDGRQIVGIRFGEMTPRRREELAELLAEINAELAAKAKVVPAASIETQDQGEDSLPVLLVHPAKQERRAQARHSVDSNAAIFLVDVASKAVGRIVDVSLGGCRICTDERFPLGIYRRVEVQFVLDGLPFRLGGVTQSLHDRKTVGIRFLDLSERKREQLAVLVEEIDQMHGDKDSRDQEPEPEPV